MPAHRLPAIQGSVLSIATQLGMALAIVAALAPFKAVDSATVRTIAVGVAADDDPSAGCTLREAIDVANAGGGVGAHANGCTVKGTVGTPPFSYAIKLPAYTYTLTGAPGDDANASGDLDITANITISGQGPGNTAISGGSIDRVFHIDPAGAGSFTIDFERLTIMNGGVAGWGAGIYNSGDAVNVSECALHGNVSGGTVAGGAISNGAGKLTIESSTLSLNASDNGGGIYNAGTLAVTNSTLSGNSASHHGGAIANGGGTATLVSTTITDSRADDDESGAGDGGGIHRTGGAVSLRNTIVAANHDLSPGPGDDHPDLSGLIDGAASNIIGSTAGCTGTAGTGSDVVAPDPGLGPLAGNGGGTLTHAISFQSPAHDGVAVCTDQAGFPLGTDQRAVARPQGYACDIGAFEVVTFFAFLPCILDHTEP
ncbi:choice-of-anchor Q domain-containing protein [Chloroflexota bacterium]